MAKDYTVAVHINARDNASGVVEKFSKGFSKWMNRAVIAAIAAAAAFSTMSMKWGMDYEAQMSAVKAVSQATAGEMAALSEKAKQLGRDSAYSATESAQGMEELLKAGLSVADTLNSVGSALDLAAAGGIEVAEAAKIAAQALNIFDLPATATTHVADVLAQAASSTATGVIELGEAMKYAGPVASGLGVSLEDTVSMLALMSKAGIESTMAGTTFRNVMMSIVDPTDEANKVLKDLGINTVNAQGKFLKMDEILEQFTPEILDTAQGIAFMNKVFGARGAPGMIQLIKEGSVNFKEFRDEMKASDGVAKTMAEVRLDNLKGAFTMLKASIEGVGIALVLGGENSLAGGMKKFIVEGIIPVINNTAKWIEQVGGLPGVLKMAWEILVAFGTEVKVALVNLFTDWETFKAFAIMFGQTLAIAIGSLSLFATEVMIAIVNVAAVAWLPLVAPLAVVISQLKELFVIFLNWLGPKFINAINTLISPFRWLMDKIGIEIGEFDWTPLTVEPALTMEEVFPASIKVVADAIGNGKDRIIASAYDLKNNFKLVGEGLREALLIANPDLLNFPEKLDEIVKSYEKVGTAAVESAEEAAAVVGPGSPLDENTKKAGENITTSFIKGWQNYIKSIPTFLEQVEANVYHMGLAIERSLADSFEMFFRTGTFSFKVFAEEVKESFWKMLADMASKTLIEEIVGGAVGYMTDLFTGDEEGDKGFAKIKKDGLKLWEDLGKAVETAASIAGKVWEAGAYIAIKAWEGLKWIGSFSVDAAAYLAGAAWAGAGAIAKLAWAGLKWIGSFSVSAAATAAGLAWAGGASIAKLAWAGLKWIGSFSVDAAATAAGLAWAGGAAIACAAWELLKWIGSFSVSAAATAAGFAWAVGAAVAKLAWAGLKWLASFSVSAAAEAAGLAWSIAAWVANMAWQALKWLASFSVSAAAEAANMAWQALKWLASFSVSAAAEAAGLAWSIAAWVANIAWQALKWLASFSVSAAATAAGTAWASAATTATTAWSTFAAIVAGIGTALLYITEAGVAIGSAFATGAVMAIAALAPLLAALWAAYELAVALGIIKEKEGKYYGTDPHIDYGPKPFPIDQPNPFAKAAGYQYGGLIPGITGQGRFIYAHAGEGVLNQRAMSFIGEGGLNRMNEGSTPMKHITIIIQALDGSDVERVFEDKLLPLIQEKTEAGVEVIHERGIKHETA